MEPSSDRRSPFAGKPGRRRLWTARHGGQMRQARTWLDVSIVGIQFPVAIALGFFWGRWMDRHLGTWPWLTGLFTLFGIAAAFVNLFRITAAAAREEEAAAEDTPPSDADDHRP